MYMTVMLFDLLAYRIIKVSTLKFVTELVYKKILLIKKKKKKRKEFTKNKFRFANQYINNNMIKNNV